MSGQRRFKKTQSICLDQLWMHLSWQGTQGEPRLWNAEKIEETMRQREEMSSVVLLRNLDGDYPRVTPDSVTWN